jgi:hypothetical protein
MDERLRAVASVALGLQGHVESAGYPTIVNTMSLAAAASNAVSAQRAPASTRASALARVRRTCGG